MSTFDAKYVIHKYMFDTFDSEYEKLEIAYSKGKTINDHVSVIRDCAIFIENCINYFTNNFHSSLKTSEERKKYLAFEKNLKKPVIKHNTIGMDKFIENLGFELSVFLISTSIKEKFNSAYKEIHYQQIIHDAHKILPNIIRSFLNKLYTKVSYDEKKQIIEIIRLNKNLVETDHEIKAILSGIPLIDWNSDIKTSIKNIIDSINILQNRPSTKKKSCAIRYLNVIDSLMVFLENENLLPILEFADRVKKKYLENGNVIEEADKKYFKNIANDLNLPYLKAKNIEKSVIATIENKLIIFQTFNKEKNYTKKANTEKEITNLFRYACLKLNDNNFMEAIADLTEIIELRYNAAFYFIYRGIAYEAIGELDKAESDFKDALSINPKHEFYFYNRGLAKYETNDFEGAIIELNKALKYSNNDPDIYYYKGEALKQLNKLEDALHAYNKAVNISPKHSGAKYELEKIKKNIKQAKKEYQKTIEINPRHTEAPRNIEKIKFKEGNDINDKNISLYTSNLFKYVCSKFHDNDFKEAINDLDEIISLKPDTAFYFVYRGLANELLNQSDAALKDFGKALELNPLKDFFHFNKGVAYFEAGFSDRAIRELNAAIKINKHIPDFYFYKALVYENSGEIENALLACNQTLDLFPGHTEAKRKKSKLLEKQTYLGKMTEKKFSDFSNAHEFFENARYHFAENDIEHAITQLNKAINILPGTAYYYVYRGIAFEKIKNYNQAKKNYTTAKKINSDNAIFFFNKAKAEFDIGDYTKALSEINNAIKIKEKFAFVNCRMRIYKKLNKTTEFINDEKRSVELQQNEGL